MKEIMMSIRPQWVKEILNGEKTIEIRKKFPKDYVGWVYIYVTKGKLNLVYDQDYDDKNQTWKKGKYELVDYGDKYSLNGKVVARFWCDKVEGAYNFYVVELCQLACINKEELYKYAGGWYKTDDLIAINITKLEIFDKPKELNNFLIHSHTVSGIGFKGEEKQFNILKPLNRAPQSWCWIDICS